jgi:hypothetical protein
MVAGDVFSGFSGPGLGNLPTRSSRAADNELAGLDSVGLVVASSEDDGVALLTCISGRVADDDRDIAFSGGVLVPLRSM